MINYLLTLALLTCGIGFFVTAIGGFVWTCTLCDEKRWAKATATAVATLPVMAFFLEMLGRILQAGPEPRL